jgi:phosphoglycolate phosphatase-like HAD superfamily hydrolase
LRAVIDLDGVVFDFDLDWTSRTGQRTTDGGVRHVRAQTPQLYDTLHQLAGLSDREAFWSWYRQTGGFRRVPPIGGAIKALHMLDDAGWDICLATARPEWARQQTVQALAQHRIPFQALVFTNMKEIERGDAFLDDNPQQLAILAHHTDKQVVRVPQPWNEPHSYPELDGMTAMTLAHFANLVTA